MLVVVVAHQKGGTGKSTAGCHLAVAAHEAGAGPVVLVDADPQGSTAAWWNARQANEPLFARATVSRLPEQLAELRKAGIRLAIIDTPPAVGDLIRGVVECADLVIVPTRPSPHDLRAAGPTVELIESAGKRLVFVINAAAPRSRLGADAAIALSQHGTVAPVTLGQRVDFASSMIDGRTVMEVDPSGRSANEVRQLWKYVSTQLGKVAK